MANDRNAGRKRILSKEQEQEIFTKSRNHVPTYEILAEYKISESTYRRIINRLKNKG